MMKPAARFGQKPGPFLPKPGSPPAPRRVTLDAEAMRPLIRAQLQAQRDEVDRKNRGETVKVVVLMALVLVILNMLAALAGYAGGGR